MKEYISIPAQPVDFKPRADRSWKLVFETRELSGSDVSLLADHFQNEGWLLYKPNEHIKPSEIPQSDADSGTKSQSQRLRDVIFIYWKSLGSKGDFESFYRTSLEKLIEYMKTKLPEEKDV